MSTIAKTKMPNLSGRSARCVCGRMAPSNTGLPGFEYRGPGSRMATDVCVCGYHRLAHHDEIRQAAVSPTLRNCPGFRPQGALEYDGFACGCFAVTDSEVSSAQP